MKSLSFFRRCRPLLLACLGGIVLSPAARAADYAMSLDGARVWVHTPVTGAQLAGAELTVEFWFKGSNIQSAVRLQSATQWINAGYGTAAAPRHRIRINATDYEVPINPVVNNGAWHHVALTYKQNTAGGIISYVDGVAHATTVNAPNLPIPAIAADVALGSFNGINEFTTGRIDEVRIWKTARTAGQIFDAYQTKPAFKGTETGLTASYGFNEADGTEVMNLAGGAPALIQGADNAARYGRVPQELSFAPSFKAIQFVSATVPAPQRVGYWKFDEAAGVTTAPADATGAYNGTFKSSVVTYGQPGARADSGTAIQFPGSGGIQFPVLPSLWRPGFTFAVFAKLTAAGGTFCSPVSFSGGGGVSIRFNANGTISYELRGSTTLTTPAAFPLNRWVHLAATFDAASGQMSLWVDGEKQATGIGGHVPQNAGLIQVNDLTGLLDEMVILDSALDAANMQLLKTQGPLSLQGTTGAFQYLDAGSGTGNAGDRLDFSAGMTVETHVSFDALPAIEAALVAQPETNWSLNLSPAGKIVYRTPGLPVTVLTGQTSLSPGRWHHVAAVFDGTAKRLTIYLNGVEDASQTYSAFSTMPASNGKLFIGARPTGFATSTNNFIGRLDEVRLWQTARTLDSIVNSAGRSLNGGELGLSGVWSFDSLASATAVADGRLPAPGVPATFQGGSLAAALVPGKIFQPASVGVNFAVWFSGTPGLYDYATVPDQDDFDLLGSRTIEAWVHPAKGSSGKLRTIISKGLNWRLVIGTNNKLQLLMNGGTVTVSSAAIISEERWQHVAALLTFTGTGTGTIKFDVTLFIDGQPAALDGLAGATRQSVEFPVPADTRDLIIGAVSNAANSDRVDPFLGGLDEVRIWNVARKAAELQFLAQRELPASSRTGLAGYWNFNAVSTSTLADSSGLNRNATLRNVVLTDWTEGGTFGAIPLPAGITLTTNSSPAAAGLWLGTVSLTKVSEAGSSNLGAPSPPTKSGGTFSFTILLHVDAAGTVRLLKDVVVMKAGVDAAARLVLVTDANLIPTFSGVQYRSGKLIGTRYSSAAYDFDTREAELNGGLGGGFGCYGNIKLSDTAATNPYRHKYHPDHGKGFALSRDLIVTFPTASNYTADRLTGTYGETVRGPHKNALSTEGTIELRRVSSVATLNQ